ncbi:MAG: peptidyl-prolyl cis-trans isomerase [Deltaproteobacteria bacterium]|nr:peptidyl-prolyl cis-trans isomerase [Deltaproteobacteria bacterium]
MDVADLVSPGARAVSNRGRSAMRRILRAPALHFFLIGGALWAALGGSRPGDSPRVREPIVMTVADIARLRSVWAEQFGRVPDPQEEARLIDEAVDEEVLYRQALDRGLDRRLPQVSDRLARLARFVDEQLPDENGAPEAAARQLGLERHDLVIRRHLAQVMRLILSRPLPSDEPSAAELADFYARRSERFVSPTMVRLSQVYVSRERHGTGAREVAGRLREELRQTGVTPDRGVLPGDPFIRGAHFGLLPRQQVAQIFGAEFAAAIDGATALQAWSEPIESPYGFHLVWLHQRREAEAPALERIRNRVLHAYLSERRGRRLREGLDRLRERYAVRVEGPAA